MSCKLVFHFHVLHVQPQVLHVQRPQVSNGVLKLSVAVACGNRLQKHVPFECLVQLCINNERKIQDLKMQNQMTGVKMQDREMRDQNDRVGKCKTRKCRTKQQRKRRTRKCKTKWVGWKCRTRMRKQRPEHLRRADGYVR